MEFVCADVVSSAQCPGPARAALGPRPVSALVEGDVGSSMKAYPEPSSWLEWCFPIIPFWGRRMQSRVSAGVMGSNGNRCITSACEFIPVRGVRVYALR